MNLKLSDDVEKSKIDKICDGTELTNSEVHSILETKECRLKTCIQVKSEFSQKPSILKFYLFGSKLRSEINRARVYVVNLRMFDTDRS